MNKILLAAMLLMGGTAAAQHVTVGGNVFGGGNKASVARGTKVLIDQAGAVITGDVYGGGALAKVDTALVAVAPQTPVAATSIDSTLVTILQGTIGGNVYGGGLGDSVPAPYNGTANVAAHVYGAVHVSIGDTVRTAPGGIVGSATINGYVFGGNNNNGSPKDNVRVDIWSTARTAKQAATYTNNDREYALSQVFGGGNKAAYLPSVNTKKDTVYIHTCDNTIEYVYGGGNAADVGTSTINSATEVIIDGGRIEWVFGGGNGFSSTGNHDNASAANYNPGANIYGNATVTYHSGDISYIFGGSNQWGNVTGAKTVNVLADGPCTKHIKELYGGSNEAPTTGSVALTMGCSASTCPIDAVFGGSRNADISANVVLNIEGGSYTNVFGGNNIGGTITGDVTLNLLGGTIDSAFGGNNAGGAINGKITVNMLDLEDANCPLVVHNIYGGGKNAAYTPSTPGAYPEVNLIHGSVTKDGSGNGGNVYGGGFGATAIVTSTPTVNVGYGTSMASTATALNGSALTSSTVAVAGNVFGGGEAALVTGSTTVTLQADNPGTSASTSVGGHVFGGGNLANVSNSTDVNINGGTVDSNVYGGGNLADVLHSTDVDINGGTVTMDVYGGGALADVGTSSSDHTNVTVTSGTVTGGVYGGGLGDDDHAALVNGAVQVTVDGGTVNDVFGCNNVNGRPTDSVRVDINSNVGGNVFGGGNLATYTGNPYVYINNGTVSGNVFGGGNGDPADNTQTKGSVTGIPHVIVGDTLTAHSAYQAIVSGDVYGGGNAAKVVTGTPVVTVLPKCNTEITSVYGGGNAADVPATSVTIHGGTIDSVYGGGHGDKDVNPAIAANVTGNTSVTITGGTIGQVFGGSNENGTISGAIGVNVNKGNNSCPMVISAVYGGGNFAASNAGTINIGCTGASSSEYIDTVFGGANRANVTGNITLNITGGRINNTFGGNNNSGAIDGDITVNVEWATPACGDNHLGNVYGAGNLASYSQKTAGHPAVNIKNGTAANVFGGGKGLSAVVTGNPVVTIGDANGSHVANVTGRVYGGGDAAAVTGNTTVTYNDNNASSVVDSIFGGGNAAGVSGTAIVTLTSGKVTGGLYGGCNTTGGVGGNITVALNGGTVGVNGTTTDVVYGGGYGHSTTTGGDVTVTLGGTTVYGNLYGGSALGSVNGSSSNTTTVTIGGANLNGSVFGGGMGSGTDASSQATTLGSVVLNYNTANTALTGIYGGANVNGDVAGNIDVNIEANVGASGNGNSLDVFGGGRGHYTSTGGNVTVTVGTTATSTLYGDIYGGSEEGEVGASGKIAKVDFKKGTLNGTIYGGGKGTNSNAAFVTGGTNVTVTTGTIGGGIYGGANIKGTVAENITVDVNGGTIGANGSPANVFGGGFGNNTSTSGNVTVNINGAGATVWGDVYGGSGFGNVGNDINDAVVVNILNGEVKGSVFGGGLGSTSPAYAATEAGTVTVNIGSGTPASVQGGASSVTGGATILGSVYGCNNTNGSSNGDVTVNIFQTAHASGTNTTADAGFAITKVFGGGKNANYSAPGKKATVNVYTCDNTIGTLFGGGDAAAVPATEVNIYGGRLGTVFGGGNGEVTAANVNGNINLNMHGGTIGTLVSASNQRGTISGTINVNVDNVNGCTETVTDFFGGANQVAIDGDVNATIECGAGTFTNVYGGSNKANIGGNVTFTIKGGTITNAFGGSKGVLGDNNTILDTAANIGGNVTLNLYGGHITNAFGGSDQNGTIAGTITVNVLDYETTDCGLEVTNVYGAGNVTAYTGSPTVNVIHGTVSGNVYGAGKGSTAVVTGNPQVNIGYVDGMASLVPSTHKYKATTTNLTAVVGVSVFGGGDEAAVTGSPIVTLDKTNSQVGNLYGGGNEAGITGSTTVTMNNGTVITGIYGGCNTSGDVTGNSTINLLGGQIGSSSNTAVVFGGGYGAATNIAGNVLVTMGNIGGTANPTIYADIYGGSALGNVNTGSVDNVTKVNSTNTTTLDILSGTLTGNIFGGGLGQREPSAIAPMVHGMVHINIGRNTGTNQSPVYTGYANLVDAKVYGCNNVNGSPQNDVHIDVYATAHPTNTLVDDTITRSYAIDAIYGGGNKADYAPENNNHSSAKKTYIRVYGCENTVDEIYGGGNAAAVVGDSVYIEGGRFNMIFGGGNGAVTAANVGLGGIHLNARSGRVGYIFEQCNKRGEVTPGAPIVYYQGGGDCNNGILRVDYHYCGGNIQDVYGDSLYTFTCTDNVRYLELYGGCRLGCHYGNITLEIQGGTIGDVYGGSMGQEGYSADVRKYPDTNDVKGHELDYPEGILTFLRDNPELQGTGGNVTLIIKGGTIGRVFGGCNSNGNVEGRITVIIDSAESNNACPLELDYVYGGGNEARYIPDTTHPYPYPLIQLKKGHVNHDVFGGGHGLATNVDAGRVESNPHIVMAPEDGKFWVKGNIYGGGEMGSVGKYTREESGKPTACVANTGHTTIEISAGKVGPAVLKMPDYKGHVFGGSKGAVGDTTTGSGNPKLCHIAYVNTSDVTISGTAFIKGSVYGGGESGRVFDSTYVKIQGGQIGCGWNDDAANENEKDLNRVYTDAEWLYDVTSDNTKFLYECNHWPFSAPYDPYDPYEHPQAYDGHTFYGNVFGGGSGMMPYKSRNVADDADSSIYIQTAGRVLGNTRVEITGGHILTSLYGGCELGDVLDTCTVIFSGGTLGVPRTLAQIADHPVTCYLFGAGKGDERVRFNTRTNVNYVRVTVDGGKIYGSVFGGGEDGHVMRDVLMDIKPINNITIGTWGTSYVDGNVFGGGRGFSGNALTAGNVAGDITVNITGGTMLGSIYGGGRLASVGYGLYPATDTNYGVMRPDDKDDAGNTVAGFSRGHITVNISGNTVIGNDNRNINGAYDYNSEHSKGGNVFGGSMGRLTKLDGTMVLPLWHRLGCAKATTVNIRDNVHVKGNVYGGSELGRVTDSITVNISGNVIVGRNAAGTTAHGNVYGGGVGHPELTAAQRAEVGNDATSDSIPTFAGLTGGTIKVNISGGAINNNVYGAGELASVGTIATVTKHTDKATSYFLSWPYEYTYNGNSGDARVNITGGTIGFINGSDTTGGNIYGSARGTVGDRYMTGRLATARVTHVDINLTNPGDKIIGDVYGSGENGHVYDSAVVTLRNGLVLGNVYGGGKGIDTYTDQLKDPSDDHLYDATVYDIIAGKVFGNTKVNILGGRVAKNVYGGGNLASVGIGNYKGYGEGTEVSSADSLLAENSGHCYVTVLGGTIGPDTLTYGTTYNGNYAVTTGHVYGAGKGIVFPAAAHVGFDYDRNYYMAYVNKTTVVIGDSTQRSCAPTVLYPHVTGIVFGGGENGHVRFDTYVQTNRGQIGVRPLAANVKSDQGHWNNRGNIFGAGRGEETNLDGSYCQSAGSVTRNTRIDVLGARIYRNVQGGGAMASVGPIKGRTGDSSTCVINVRLPLATDTLGGPSNTNNAFGGYIGGGSRGIPSPDGYDNSALATCWNSQINIYRGWLKNTIYGGGENGQMLGNTQVNVYGDFVRSAIYGGGKGSYKADATEAGMPGTYLNDTLSGYVFGNTEVNLLGGTVPFTYGGGRRASVGGNATVNIGRNNGGTYEGNVKFQSSKRSVYGGNQYAGTPRGSIYVNVYKTAHTVKDAASYTEADADYAIGEVYGGSYNSNYEPNRTGRYAQVHVYGCDNTIKDVYGGGAAANVGAKPGIGADCKVIIDGGRFGNVFGGGNGSYDRATGTSVPANIYGAAITEIHGGTIGSLFGGSNFQGQADTIRISVEHDGACGTSIEGDEFFGGSNQSNLGTPGNPTNLITTLGCGVNFRAAYGGSNEADIIGDVTFTIKGGEFQEVYAGSKGAIVPENYRQTQKDSARSDITGNTHLIIQGGKIHNAYGGSNINGNITGTITVDIDSTYNTTECPWNVDYVYGGSNLTQYLPNDSTVTNHSPSPQVNILCGTVNNDVYGGGKGDSDVDTAGLVQSNPQVVMSQTAKGPTWVKGSIYGGGELAITDGNTEVNISAGTVGVEGSATTNGNVYGGGRGDASKIKAGLVKRNSTVNIAGGRVWHNVYGGGSMASVGTFTYGAVDRSTKSQQITSCTPGTGLATVYISGGIIGNDGHENGMVFGSSRGNIDTILARMDTMAWAYATKVIIGDTTVVHNMTSPEIKGSVYGGGENGHVKQNAYVHIYSGQVGYQSDRADDNTKNIDKSDPTYEFRGNVYGAGCGTDKYHVADTVVKRIINGVETTLKSVKPGHTTEDSVESVYSYNMYAGVVQGNTHVKISGGHIFHNVYGGGAMANVGTISSLVQYKDMFADGSAHKFGLSYPNNFTFVEPTGYVHIDITGGRIGTMGSYDGDVFGGARGEAGDRFKMARYGNVRTAVININMTTTIDAAYALDTFDVRECITGSVYGGAENGHINDSTFITLTNGLVGHALYGGGKGKGEYIMHNLKHQYTKSGEGGWKAGDDSTATIFSLTAGKVYGNTRVVMNGGHVVRNIYGGGNQGSVGKGNYHGGSGDYCSAGYGERLEAADTAVWLPLFRSSGTSTVIVNDGTVGLADPTIKDSLPYGNVFGGCRGTAAPNVRQTLSPRVLYYPIFFAGYSNRTRVIIGDGTHTPRIYGSVYGGGMDGHVRWGTHVTVKSGEIGLAYNEANQTAVGTDNLDRKQWFLRGSVYGAGSGLGQYEATLKHTTERAGEGGWDVGDDSVGYLYSSSAGSVTHFTRVDIEGGTIHNNVYGGGSLASVGPPMMGQRHNAPIDSSLSVINISGGTIGTFDDVVHYSYGGKVFGGSRGQIDVDNASFSTVVWTQVNLSGGQAYGSVYGGGEVGTIKEDAYVNVSGGIVGPNVAVKTTGPGGDSLSCVYGGGKGIGDDPSSTYKTFTNVNNTHVAVSGGRVCGSVFGGAEDGHVLGNTNVTISNTVASSAYAEAHAGVAEGDVLSIPIIGTGGYTHEYDGCVLGGGRNALNKNASAGRVQGNTHVTVTGGRIMRTILGGGALARVGVNVDGGFKGIGAGNDTISFKDNSGNYDSINHGTTLVQVSGDTLLVPSANFDNVFVDGRTYRDIFSGTTVPNPAGTDSVVYLTTIGAPDGPILVDNDYTIGDIFGGGKGDTKDTVDILAGKVMNTYVKVSGSPRIMADIYAGGEMSCVGWYDTTGANTGVYYPKTGYTHVEISDDPRTGTPYEFSCANIHYGRPWTLIDSVGRLYHTCSGNVYGGGQGYVEEDGTHRWNWVQMGRVYQTEVKIHGGHFMGNVFGGGSRGIVKKDCHVTITGGTFGNHIVDDTTIYKKIYDTTFTNNEHTEWSGIDSSKYDTLVFNNRYNYGSIFGGGYGNHKTFWHVNDSCFVKAPGDTIKMQPLEFAGRVYGNTYLTITGGHIMDCVFGGGDMASTGWVERDADGKFQFNDPTKRHGGVCNVEISGNTIVGPLDYFGHNAYVYAAGRGVGYDPSEEFKTYCNVNEAHLIVALTEGAAANLSDKGPDQWDTTTMGGRIWGSLFGGGADSHVLDSVSVVVHSGLVGTQGTTSYDGNIFGGGRNYLNTNHTNGRVQGNIRVFVDGGTLQGTLYGGGRLAMSGIDTVGHFIDSTHGNVDILVRGDVVIGNHTADSLLKSDESCGDIFGSGKGDIKNYEDIWAGRVTNAKITVKDSLGHSPRIYGSIFGGGEMASLGYWDDTITDGEGHVVFHTDGTGGTDYGVMYENTGRAVINLSGNLTVGSSLEYTVAPYANPGKWTIYESTATDTTLVHTCTGNVFGGCQGDVDVTSPRWVSMGRSASAVVNISGGTYYGNIFGGSEQGIVTGDTRVNISGGNFGYTGSINNHLSKVYSGDIYAAGYGCDDPAEYDDVTPNDSTVGSMALSVGWNPGLLAGRTFGNSRVDITGGHIAGSVYGGGSFASVGDDKPGFTVNGNTTVNIGLPGADPDDKRQATGSATIDGEVFGANNFSGTAYGNTAVHIYKTAHDGTNNAPTAEDTKALVPPTDELTGEDVEAIDTTGAFALKAVYGGGNRASHAPIADDGTTLVHVHYCEENTIKQVYGGGNAADTKNNHVIIDGGYIYEVFGGGNGAGEGNPGADVSGTAHTEILGGLITNVFGGSNSKGNIGNTILEIEPDGNCDIMVANTYGGSNEAEGGGGVINLLCGTKIGTFYGGSRKANLVGDITLNVYGGTYENIFGGSQGAPSEPANIEGNVTLNFYGGNVQRLFGASDVNGNISGTVLVNVDIDPDYSCPDGLRLDTVYGAGRDAAYSPYDPFRGSPTVNIMNNRYHVSGSTGTMADSTWVEIIDVFGGGLGATATVTSYPRVVIGGFEDGSKNTGTEQDPVWTPYTRGARIFGNAYGGGSMAPTNGNTIVYVRDAVIGETEESFTSGNLFGGGYGTTSKVTGDTYVGVFGLSDIKSNVYGGGNAGIVTGNTEVVIGYQKQVIVPEFIAYVDTVDKGQPSEHIRIMGGFHSTTPGVHFRYTTDGSIPTTSTGNLYTDDFLDPNHDKAHDFEIEWGVPIQMIAYLWDGPANESTGKVDSSMIPSIVGFDKSTAPIITIKDGTAHVGDPDSANFNGSVGAMIYYTLNGDTPTATQSTTNFLWGTTGENPGVPFAIGETDVVKAIAVQRGCFNSEVSFLTADAPTVDNGTNTNIFTVTAKPGERIIYTLGTIDVPTPISTMNQGQRPGQGPGETGMVESTDDAPGHTATASDGSTVTHKKRVYTNSKGETVTYRWSEVTAASSGNTTVTITAPSGTDCTVKAIVERAGYAPSPIAAAVYRH